MNVFEVCQNYSFAEPVVVRFWPVNKLSNIPGDENLTLSRSRCKDRARKIRFAGLEAKSFQKEDLV